MLARGTRLGPYEVVSPLGEGGMGEVYRARDTRLDRTVALKVLNSKIDATPDIRARFEREARAIAALQHPNICVLHDLGREGETSFLVMEYLEGETLATRLGRGPLPLTESVALGIQIAGALDRAHRAGIVHRDLKPANVMLVKAGGRVQAKLLDFGLAKAGMATAAATAVTSSIAVTAPAVATQAGVIMGTIPYMAPEQFEGREADVRSDIYAFGCVLYEMATAEPAFKGTHVVAPPGLNRLIQLCLQRNPDERLGSAHDAGLLLAAVPSEADVAPRPQRQRRGLPTMLVVALMALAAAATWLLRPARVSPRTVTEITPPPGWHFNFGGSYPGMLAVSPDGRKVVFGATNASGRSSLWLRPLDGAQARELPGTQSAVYPFWSPDSASIGYFTQPGPMGGGNLMTLNLAAGLPTSVIQVGTPRGGSWAPDGTIIYPPDALGGLVRVPAGGGTAIALPGCDAKLYSSCRYPYFLPDGRHFLYMAISHTDSSNNMLFEASLDGRMNRPLLHSATPGIFAAGKLLYSNQGTLMAQTLNPATGTLSGAAQAIATGVFDDPVSWRAGYSSSGTGTLVFAGGANGQQSLAWFDRGGKLLATLPAYTGEVDTASVAPDGKLLAISLDQGAEDIWTEAVAGGPRARLTFGPFANLYPTWSPDGAAIAYFTFASDGPRIARQSSRGGAEQLLARAAAPDGGRLYPTTWSPDGRALICTSIHEIAVLDLARDTFRVLVADARAWFGSAALSPDGKWVSYLSGDPGQTGNVFVIPFQGTSGARWQATTSGAISQFWVNGSRELDVVDGDGRLLAIPVHVNDNAPSFGAPRVLAANFPAVQAATLDGQRFLATQWPDDHQHLMVVSNWLEH